MPESVLTIPEVALILKVSEKTVYTMAQQGKLPCFKVGQQWRFREEDINKWMESQIDQRGQS